MSAELDNNVDLTQGIKPLIIVDRTRPQLLAFDQSMAPEERLLKKILPIKLRVANADNELDTATSEISVNKLRITVPKTTVIQVGTDVTVSFTTLYAEFGQGYFLHVPYQVSEQAVFAQVIHLVLTLNDSASKALTAWLPQWLKKAAKIAKYEDNNDILFNYVFYYYKRLYCIYLTYPVIFSNTQGIQYAFASPEAMRNVDFGNGQQADAKLPLAVLNHYISAQKIDSRQPLYIWYEEQQLHYLTNADVAKASPKQIIAWLQTKTDWRVLLLRTRQIKTPTALQLNAIARYGDAQIVDESVDFEGVFNQLTTVTNVLDISCLFTNLELPLSNTTLHTATPSSKLCRCNYEAISFKVQRVEPRYPYNTGIQVQIHQPEPVLLNGKTLDISSAGVSVQLPYTNIGFSLNSTVSLDFSHWNETLAKNSGFFAKKTKLSPVEYEIVNITHGETCLTLGLLKRKTPQDTFTTSFIKDKLADIKRTVTGLLRNDYDLYQAFYAATWLTHNIPGLPFFMAQDQDGNRIIQAIVTTQENLKLCYPFATSNDWSFLQQIAPILGLALSDLLTDAAKPLKILTCGVYCYFEPGETERQPGYWKTKTDFEFKAPAAKREFIQTALAQVKHSFYHCALVAIKGNDDDILNKELMPFFTQAPHRVKEIQTLCDNLVALGELNDTTRLIEFMYKN